MNPETLTAVILAGGKGERLRPFTEHMPKPLVPLRGRPLLHHLLDYLAGFGIRRFVLCTGYKAEEIERFVTALKAPWEIQCVNSGDASMATRILDALPYVAGPALVCYGDTLANVDLSRLCHVHTEQRALATVTVHPLQSAFGIVDVAADGRVSGLREKPVLPYWINIGYLLCEPAALAQLEPGTDLVQFLSRLVEQSALAAYQHPGRHLTINDERERAKAEAEIPFFTVQEGVDS